MIDFEYDTKVPCDGYYLLVLIGEKHKDFDNSVFVTGDQAYRAVKRVYEDKSYTPRDIRLFRYFIGEDGDVSQKRIDWETIATEMQRFC